MSIFRPLFKRWDKNPMDQNYYVKIFFAIISAIICGLGGPIFAGLRGLMFGVLMYVVSLFVIVYDLNIDPEDLGGRQKLITNSLPSYLLLWVLLWTIFYAFTLPPDVISGLAP